MRKFVYHHDDESSNILKNTQKKNQNQFNIDFLSSESNGGNESKQQISKNLNELDNLQKLCVEDDKQFIMINKDTLKQLLDSLQDKIIKSSSEDNIQIPADLQFENVFPQQNMFSFNDDFQQIQHQPGIFGQQKRDLNQINEQSQNNIKKYENQKQFNDIQDSRNYEKFNSKQQKDKISKQNLKRQFQYDGDSEYQENHQINKKNSQKYFSRSNIEKNNQTNSNAKKLQKSCENQNSFQIFGDENFLNKKIQNIKTLQSSESQQKDKKLSNRFHQQNSSSIEVQVSQNEKKISDNQNSKNREIVDLNLKIQELNRIIKQKDKQINEMKGYTEGQEKFMNMVVHDMRNPSEAINNGLKQAKEMMKADIQKLMTELKQAFKKNQRLPINNGLNRNIQRNLSMDPSNEQQEIGINSRSLKKLKSGFKSSLLDQKFHTIKAQSFQNNSLEPKFKNKNEFSQKKLKMNLLNQNQSSSHNNSIQSLQEKINQEQEIIQNQQRLSRNSQPHKNILRVKIKRLTLNNQIEEEKVHIDPNESLNRPLSNSPIFKNMQSYQSINQQMQEPIIQIDNQIRLSQQVKSENLNREDEQINLIQNDQDIVGTLNSLAFCIQNYYNERQNNERVIYANVQQDQNNEGSSDEQNSSMYDFGSEDIEENQKNSLSRNIEEFNQKKKNKACLLNVQDSDLNVNQPRSFYNHENSKYLKRKKTQNLRSFIQNMQISGNNIGREVIIFKEKTVLQIDRSIQTGVDSSQSEYQFQEFQKIMHELKKLLQNRKLKDFINIYTNYCELISKVEEVYNQQIIPSELVNQLIQQLNLKANQKLQPRYISSLIDANRSIKVLGQQNLEANLEIIEASQSISACSNNNAMSYKESNQQIEALKRVQNNNMVRVSNQNQMKRFKISNLNQESLQSSDEIQQFVREYDQNIPSIENDSEQIILYNRLPKNTKMQQSSKTLQRFTAQNQQSQIDTKDIKLMICVIEKLKQALKINKTIEFYIQNSISSANIIANLTEDLLTLAKIKNNVFELNPESKVNLLDIVNDAYQVLGFNAASKKIGLLLEFDDQKTFMLQNVTTDKRRILQILLNFLSNSIKFTNDEGYIKVSYKILEEVVMQSSLPMEDNLVNSENMNEEIKKNIKLEIAIQDTGAGISKENISKLFTDFAKLNEHKQMNAKGTGLGLSICKQIIEQMGGKVAVVSQVGVGTKFKITINMDAQDRIVQEINLSNRDIKSEKKVFSEMFENNFGVDVDYQKKHETSLDQIENDQIFEKKKSSKVYKFDSSKNAVSPQENDKNQKFINKMLQIMKKKLKDYEKIETSNSNSSFLNEMNRLEMSESKSQFDITDNLLNFNPLKRSSHFMGSLVEQNSNEYDQQSELKYEEEKKEPNNDLIQYRNINQINYLPQENHNQNDFNVIKSPLEIKEKHIEIMRSQQKKDYQRNDANQNQASNFTQNENSLIKIDEMKESSSQNISLNNDQKNVCDSQLSSNIISIYSSLRQKSNPSDNDELQNYLNKNNVLKQVIDISIKYKRHKLQFLAANDDSYSLFFIQTSVSQMKNVSLLDTAENGQVAVNFVTKNVTQEKDEDDIHQNFYDAIFLDLDMPILNGSEACKQIQQHYYERKKSCYEPSLLHQNPLIIQLNGNQRLQNVEIEEQMQSLRLNKIIPQWVKDLKSIYDQYIEICEKEEQSQDPELSNHGSNLQIRVNQTKNQVLIVFNILYSSQRYKALQIMERPFIFAYSAFTNQKIKDETNKNGFDKLIDAPLNKLKVEEIIEQYIEPYAQELTKIMLQNIGPIPKFEEMIDKDRLSRTKKISSGNMYQSVFQDIDLGPKGMVSRDFNRFFQNDLQKIRNSEDIQEIESDEDSSASLGEELIIIKRKKVVKIAGLSLIKEGEEEVKEQNLIFEYKIAVADLPVNSE